MSPNLSSRHPAATRYHASRPDIAAQINMSISDLAFAAAQSELKAYYEKHLRDAIQRAKWGKMHSQSKCFYSPPVCLTRPAGYDVYRCCHYLINELKTRGFEVDFTFPNLISIDLQEESTEEYSVMKELVDAHRESIKKQKNAAKMAKKTDELMSGAFSAGFDTVETQTEL
jgi:hypothetical protein